jgi:hypothetical protein
MDQLQNKTLIALFSEQMDSGIKQRTTINLIKSSEGSYIKISQTNKDELALRVVNEIFIESLHWDLLADSIITCCSLTENDTL